MLREVRATGKRGQDFPAFLLEHIQPLCCTARIPFIIRPVEALSLAIPELDE